jgi:hypothetical protein
MTIVSVWVPPESTTSGVFDDTMEKPAVCIETDWTVHDAGPNRLFVYERVQLVEND